MFSLPLKMVVFFGISDWIFERELNGNYTCGKYFELEKVSVLKGLAN